MSFLNRFSINSSGQIVTNSAFAGTPTYHDGLAYDETGPDTLVVSGAGGTPAAYQAGIGFNSAGAMLIVDASAGLPAGTVWLSGLPISAGQLCVDSVGAVVSYVNGVGYTSTGAVGVTQAGVVPFSAEASQFFDRLLTPPTSARATLYAALIDALVTGGVWAKLDVLDVFAAADSGTSLINLKSASFQASLNHSVAFPTFTVDRGWSASAAAGTKSVSLAYNPSTAAGNYTRNDALIGGWVTGSTTEQKGVVIQTTGNGNVEIYPRYSASPTYWAVNTDGTEATYVSSSPAGLWVAQRTASNAMALYLNNVSVATSALASAALINENLVSDTTANTTLAVVIGASLSSGQLTTLYTSLQTYLTAVGAI